MNKALEVIDVGKTYKKGLSNHKVLKGVSFNVEQGEAFGFIGANGTGKSTTIKIILDLIKADQGSVRINGIDSRDYRSREGVAFLPETPYLNDVLTPLEIVRLGVNLHQVKPPNMDKYCLEYLEKFGMAEAANKPIWQMSKGMVQRTGLAHCLAVNPRLLILDEPLSGLDPIGRVEVVELLAEYHKKGGTLLFTSHVLHDVERIADKFALISGGRISAIKTREDMLSENRSFHVQVIGNELPDGGSYIDTSHFSLVIDSDDLWRKLEILRTQGYRLVSVTPELNLESFFIESAVN
jgi:ABC-2 type transport system ATP-binding protein